MKDRPNIVFVFADELRAQDTGFGGNVDCHTPVLDAFAGESLNLTHAVSGSPVCSPYRASLMTGQYPINHGVYINDVELDPRCNSIARAFGSAGYSTGYIGKWHIYGSPDGKHARRHSYVPRDCQLGFDFWKGFECTHEYNDSYYFHNEDDTPQRWAGYDAFAQSSDAADFISSRSRGDVPYLLMLSWGPPHFPLHTAPQKYLNLYAKSDVTLRPNVPKGFQDSAKEDLRGNYAHISALDDCLAVILNAIAASGETDNTIVVFTSDHGDMFGSHGLNRKCVPWDESIRVPFLVRWPGKIPASQCELPLDAPDIMPTLLGLSGLPVPDSVDGTDFSQVLLGHEPPREDEAALLSMPVAFTTMLQYGFKAYRGLRSARYTYIRDTDGPWLLYDNKTDPFQKNNLVGNAAHHGIRLALDAQLMNRLASLGDEFHESRHYLHERGLAHYDAAQPQKPERWIDPWKDSE